MIFLIIALFITGLLWLVLTFLELPIDNTFNAREYWQSKENKWIGKKE